MFLTQSLDFLQSVFPSPKTEYLDEEGDKGVSLPGFITMEYFTGDQEPAKRSQKGLRLQIWHRLRAEQPKGWLSLGRFLSRGAVALVDLTDQGEWYWRYWSQYAKRYRKKWLGQNQYSITRVDLREFLQAYQESTLKKSLIIMFSRSLRHYSKVYQDNLELLVVKEIQTGKTIAGLAVVYDQATSQTFHPVAFILPEARKSYAQVGLMDYWFRQAIEKKYHFLNLGVMWLPWDPPSWKGYSEFKTHFSPEVCIFRPPLVRLLWNR